MSDDDEDCESGDDASWMNGGDASWVNGGDVSCESGSAGNDLPNDGLHWTSAPSKQYRKHAHPHSSYQQVPLQHRLFYSVIFERQ